MRKTIINNSVFYTKDILSVYMSKLDLHLQYKKNHFSSFRILVIMD